MSSLTDPDATSLPLSITTAWLQICSTSAEYVTRKQHRRPGVGDAVDQLAHFTHLAGVETVRGLVEHEHVGTAEQDAREAQPLAHALGVGLDLPVDGVAEAGDGQRALEIGIGELRAARLPPELEVRHPGEVRDEGGGFDERADPAEQRATRPNRLPEEARVAGGGMDQTEQHSERGGLPGAVRAEQSADLALLDAEAEVVDGEYALELFREAAYLDDRLAHANARRGRLMERREGTGGAYRDGSWTVPRRLRKASG